MMRYFTLLLLAIAIISGCDEDNPSKPDGNENVQIFKSVNIKTEGVQYFTFSTNSGTTTKPASWDIAFGTVPLIVESAPCEFFTMPNDPVILTGENISMARIKAASLDNVTEIPDASTFQSDDKIGTPFIGKTWFNQQYEVNPDVFIIKTCAGNFAAIQLKRYDMDFSKMQISNIVCEFKFIEGSTDLSSAVIDSFATGNAYDESKYYSFTNGFVTEFDTYDLKFDGSSIWLGQLGMCKKLENTSLADITTVADSGFESDQNPSYVSLDWYNYEGNSHVITPDDLVFVVNTADGKYPAFEITNYYDDQGNSGQFTIEWKYLK